MQYNILKKRGNFVSKQIRTYIYEIVSENIKGYILLIAVFFAGMILSSILSITSGSEEEIKIYIADFISNVKNYGVDPQKTFQLSMRDNIKQIVIFFLMSTSVLGSIGILMCTFVKGFSFGAIFGALTGTLGIKMALLLLCVVSLHLIVSVPCFASYSLLCLKNSYIPKIGLKNISANLLRMFLCGILCIVILCVSSFVQAYLEPFLLRMIKM